MKCEIHECENIADSKVTWGPNEKQSGLLCLSHIQDVWKMAGPLITVGKLFWIQEEIKEDTEYSPNPDCSKEMNMEIAKVLF